MRTIIPQLARFGAVGLLGLVIDVGLFSLLRVTVLAPEEVAAGPVIAKIISTSVAIVANWLGNRHWTFRRDDRGNPVGEGAKFVLVCVSTMVIPVSCLWVSHYVLGFTSLLADNIATNGIGLVLGMVVRFWLYRTWVFAAPISETTVAPQESGAPQKSGATESPVRPSGIAPLHRVQTVATVDDHRGTGD